MKKLLTVLILCMSVVIFQCAKKLPSERLDDARKDLMNSDPVSAMMKLTKLIKDHPNDPIVFDAKLLLVNCKVSAQDFEGAKDILNDLIKEYTLNDERGRVAFGSKIALLVDVKRTPEALNQAIAEIEKCIEGLEKKDGFYFKCSFELAQLYRQSNQNEKAITNFKALYEESKNPENAMNVARILADIYDKQEETKKALEIFKNYDERFPGSRFHNLIFFEIGLRLRTLGDEKKAAESFEKGRQGFQSAIEETLDQNKKTNLMLQLGQAYDIFLNDQDKALKILMDITDNYKEARAVPMAMYMILGIYTKRDDEENIKLWANRIITNFPGSSMSQTARGLLMTIGREKDQPSDAGTTSSQEAQKP